MKTREKNVIVEITDNGRVRRRSYPIADENGNLMTNRLRRLISGKLGHSYSDEGRSIHFVGMVWNKPYIILQELVAERMALQRTLMLLGDQSNLALAKPRPIPTSASHEIITTLVLKELKLRDKMKVRINQLRATSTK